MKSTFFCFFVLAGFSSCGLFTNKNLAKRHRNLSNNMFANSSQPQTFVQVDLHSNLIREAATPTVNYNVLTLTDKGQEALIQALNSKTANLTTFTDALTSNMVFNKEPRPAIRIIPKTVKKSIVFTINRIKYFAPVIGGPTTFNNIADCVAFLELTVRIPNVQPAVFDSWDRFVTDHYTLNLGKVTSAQQWNAALTVNAKAGAEVSLSGTRATEDFDSDTKNNTLTLVNTGANGSATSASNLQLVGSGKQTTAEGNALKGSAELGGSATVGYNDKYETSLDLSSQILKLSGSLAERQIILRQESGQGLDLSGNVVVSVEYLLTDDWAAPIEFIKTKNLYAAGAPVGVPNIQTSFQTVIFPDLHNDITGVLDFTFLYRQVLRGGRHLPEARHKVKYWYGQVLNAASIPLGGAMTTLVKTEDVRPKSYDIMIGAAPMLLNGHALSFETATEATVFLRYLGDASLAGVSLAGLTVGGIAFAPAAYAGVHIVTILH